MVTSVVLLVHFSVVLKSNTNLSAKSKHYNSSFVFVSEAMYQRHNHINGNEVLEYLNERGSSCSRNIMEEIGGLVLKIRNTNEFREISISKLNFLQLHHMSVIMFVAVAVICLMGHILKTWIAPALTLLLVGCVFMHLHFASISNETLTLIPSLGVQISSQYATGRRVTKFIPSQQVQDIIIHEAVTMHEVVYYMAVLLRHQDQKLSHSLVPVFLNSMPRLNMLRDIHRSVHEMLDFRTAHGDMDTMEETDR